MRADGVVAHHFTIPPGEGVIGYRYVIDLAAAVQAADTSAPTDHSVQVKTRRGRTAGLGIAVPARKVVVIDAGHGGHDPGAQSADVNEKDITLAAALALRDRLELDGRYRVVMTRSTDMFVPLEERVRIARHAGADLFIALHADSAGADMSTHGASVYTLSDHGEGQVNRCSTATKWFSRAAGSGRIRRSAAASLDTSPSCSTLNRSSVFAQLLVDRLSERIDLLPKSHRDAGYFVLLAPDVPAVLLEMGFITSPRDEGG